MLQISSPENPENIQAEDAGGGRRGEGAEEIEAAAPKGPVSAATKAAEANTGTGANADGKVTVHYTYGLSALAKYRGRWKGHTVRLHTLNGQGSEQAADRSLLIHGRQELTASQIWESSTYSRMLS